MHGASKHLTWIGGVWHHTHNASRTEQVVKREILPTSFTVVTHAIGIEWVGIVILVKGPMGNPEFFVW